MNLNIKPDTDLIKQRKQQYGNNFPEICAVWNKYLQEKNIKVFQLSEIDIAKMMALMKTVRFDHQYKNNLNVTDSLKDYINYDWIANHYDEYLQL